MKTRTGATIPIILVMIALGVAAVSLQALHDRRGGASAANVENLLYVRSPEAMRRLALSFDALLADVYWIRAVQHFGRTRLSTEGAKRYDLLYPLLDLTTSMDPHFNVAYLFGSIFLSEPPPGGPGRPDLAVALLEKGLRAQPDKWDFVHAIGFVYYWWYQDYRHAADWFGRAAKFPNAPTWMAPLAATTLAQGGSREASRLLWQQIARAAENDWYREEALRRLRQLDALDALDRLQQVVDAFRQRHGTVPRAWADLRAAGFLRGVPVDPAGIPYRLDGGRVRLDEASPLSPLPVQPFRLR